MCRLVSPHHHLFGGTEHLKTPDLAQKLERLWGGVGCGGGGDRGGGNEALSGVSCIESEDTMFPLSIRSSEEKPNV